MPSQRDLLSNARRGLLKIERHVAANIRAPAHPRTRTTTEEVFKDGSAEDISKRIENIANILEASPRVSLHARVTIPIIAGAFLFVAKHFVGDGRFFEFADRIFVIAIAIGMILDRQLAISSREFIRSRRSRDFQHFIVVALSGCHSCLTLSQSKSIGQAILPGKKATLELSVACAVF